METGLTIDFFESGVGETIRITFPDGGLGIVDAHPSGSDDRPPILELVKDHPLHFVCLTHPHADHGRDLIPILEHHPSIASFWHTLSDVSVFVFSSGQIPNFRSPLREVVRRFYEGWGRFLTEIALEYGGRTILLGADALKKNWESAARNYRRLNLEKATILKVPHHGAANAMGLHKKETSYLDLCSPKAVSVLFAGDVKHPDARVEEKLKAKTELACLVNGLHGARRVNTNPLGLMIPGAKAVARAIPPCQPVISFRLDPDGTVKQTAGHRCADCPLAAA